MHHPHLPEELTSFGKHLFATFLGLLMALGLEQWREHHMEQKLTAQTIAQVEAELNTNLKGGREILEDMPNVVRDLNARVDILQTYLKTPLSKRPKAVIHKKSLTINSAWMDGAWENLKSLDVLRHMDSERALHWSALYTLIAKFQSASELESTQLSRYLFYLKHPEDTWPSLNNADLERLLELMYQSLGYARATQLRTQLIVKEIEKDLHRFGSSASAYSPRPDHIHPADYIKDPLVALSVITFLLFTVYLSLKLRKHAQRSQQTSKASNSSKPQTDADLPTSEPPPQEA